MKIIHKVFILGMYEYVCVYVCAVMVYLQLFRQYLLYWGCMCRNGVSTYTKGVYHKVVQTKNCKN